MRKLPRNRPLCHARSSLDNRKQNSPEEANNFVRSELPERFSLPDQETARNFADARDVGVAKGRPGQYRDYTNSQLASFHNGHGL